MTRLEMFEIERNFLKKRFELAMEDTNRTKQTPELIQLMKDMSIVNDNIGIEIFGQL